MKRCLALLPGLLVLSACQAGSPAVSSAAPVPAGTASDVATPADTVARGGAASLMGDTITVQCGGTSFHLRQGEPGRDAEPVVLMGEPDAATALSGPAELAGYVPVGIACLTSAKTGDQWLAVQYGEAEGGCRFCEWVHLFDTRGRLLTRSVPPVLSDESLPPAQRQSPNNREFTRLSEELQLERPDFRFLPRK